MARTTSEEYEAAEVTFFLEEGAWTDSDLYKEGGYFASPLSKGDYVEVSNTTDWRVKALATASSMFGILKSEPQGPHVANQRHATVDMFGGEVREVYIVTNSGTIARGASITPSGTSGLFILDGSANGTFLLNEYLTGTGTTAAGTMVPVLFGAQVW